MASRRKEQEVSWSPWSSEETEHKLNINKLDKGRIESESLIERKAEEAKDVYERMRHYILSEGLDIWDLPPDICIHSISSFM